jgi:hypothetical protein
LVGHTGECGTKGRRRHLCQMDGDLRIRNIAMFHIPL